MNTQKQLRFRDYPLSKVAAWLDTLPHDAPPARRAWKKFTAWACDEYGDFADAGGDGGFSGAPKLLAASYYIIEMNRTNQPLPETVGDALDAARAAESGLGWLPPVEHAVKIAKAAGRPDLFKDTEFEKVNW